MKRFVTFLCSITTSASIYAQQPEMVVAHVNYSFTHIQDSTQRYRPYKENMLLIVGKNTSLYTSQDKINQLERMAMFIREQAKANGGTLSNVIMQKGLIRPVSLTDYYFFANDRKMVTIENMRERFRIDEDASPIPWKIKKDTMNFSGITCQKAVAYFKGRNWVAWFAPDLPFASGPWKLNSLPGLIIEAYDERNDVQFRFSGLTTVNENSIIKKNEVLVIGTTSMAFERETYAGREIKIPINTIKATREEVDKLKKAIIENPAAALNSLIGGSTTTVKRISGPSSTPQSANKINLNNPIELPEKK